MHLEMGFRADQPKLDPVTQVNMVGFKKINLNLVSITKTQKLLSTTMKKKMMMMQKTAEDCRRLQKTAEDCRRLRWSLEICYLTTTGVVTIIVLMIFYLYFHSQWIKHQLLLNQTSILGYSFFLFMFAGQFD